MAQTLYSDEIPTVAEANERFATEKGLLVLRPGRSCCSSAHFTIPSGCYALVSRHGGDEEYVFPDNSKSLVWPAGLHYPHPPWVRVSNLVTQQAIVLDLPVKACKTKDNVTVNIDAALAFRIMGNAALGEDPDLVRKFVYELRPRGLEQQLRDAQDEEVRTLARSLQHTEIYGIRSGENLKFIQSSSMAQPNPKALKEIEAAFENESEEEEKVDADEEMRSVAEDPEGEHIGSDAASTPSKRPRQRDGDSPRVTFAADESDSLMYSPSPSLSSDLPQLTQPIRDKTLEGTSDKADRVAAKSATVAGENVTEYMKRRLNRQFMPQGVEILSIMIKSCTLNADIEQQMEEKTMVISKNAQQRMIHQNTMQTTRMEEEVQTLMQTFEEQRSQEQSAGAERINEEKVQLNDAIAEASKSEAGIREETSVKINNLRADSSLAVQRIVSRKEETLATMRAEAKKEASELLARTNLEAGRVTAEADLIAARNRANASLVLAKAEGIIAPYLAMKNEYLTRLKEMDVYRNLASNEGLMLGGFGDDDDANVILAADAILSDAAANGKSVSRSAMMAELSLMRKGSEFLFRSNHPPVVVKNEPLSPQCEHGTNLVLCANAHVESV